MNRPNRHAVIVSLRPDADYSWTGDDYAGLVWHAPAPPPAEADIASERLRLHALWEAQDYARKRAEEYPGLDQLIVALWEAQIEGRPTTAQDLQALREAVKQKYPKP